MLVKDRDTGVVYKVRGSYFNTSAGEGKVYLQDKSGIDKSVTFSDFLKYFQLVEQKQTNQLDADTLSDLYGLLEARVTNLTSRVDALVDRVNKLSAAVGGGA